MSAQKESPPHGPDVDPAVGAWTPPVFVVVLRDFRVLVRASQRLVRPGFWVQGGLYGVPEGGGTQIDRQENSGERCQTSCMLATDLSSLFSLIGAPEIP